MVNIIATMVMVLILGLFWMLLVFEPFDREVNND